jgi:hypothetical protein
MNRSAFRTPLIAGVILAVIGMVGFAIPYVPAQQTKDVATIGDLKLQTTESKPYVIARLVSEGVVVLGVVLIGAGLHRRT